MGEKISSSSLESNNSSIRGTYTGKAENDIILTIEEKPKILPLPNGPYYLLNDMKPKIVEIFRIQKVNHFPLSVE